MLPDLTPIADAQLLDHTGAEVTLKSAWADGPAILVFLRHYG